MLTMHHKRPQKLPVIRNRYFMIADFIVLPLSISASFLLRFSGGGLQPFVWDIVVLAMLALFLKPLAFYGFGIYRRHWRYASINELFTLAGAMLIGEVSVLLGIYLFAPCLQSSPSQILAILCIDWLVSFSLVGGVRLFPRLMVERSVTRLLQINTHQKRPQYRVLVMGAGDAGALIVREMLANPEMGFVPVGLLDDNLDKAGLVIHGVTVRGTREDIPKLVLQENIDEVIIAMPTAPGRAIREVVAICQQADIPYRTMPGIYELISGSVSVKQVREVHIGDLLRRDPIQFFSDEIEPYLVDAVVLITGAGGSIGSELSRQIARQGPQVLLLMGHGENSIYHIFTELKSKYPHLNIVPLIANVCDLVRLREIFEIYGPTIVFHAAAHKHVPLMETNVPEAVTNNIFGTRNLLQISEEYNVQRFVLVSTDKAVNPTNIMGATKRIAELLVQATAHRCAGAYVTVRFGNVLGSRGSVVPLFQKQIAAGGPVTVTHPDMSRYFMTIPEAVHLIIQAGALGEGSETFVLDMGEPVYIVDLVSDLIRLSGLEPGRDIEICFTGMRPGEKIYESLFLDDEDVCETNHSKIFVAHTHITVDVPMVCEQLAELQQLVHTHDASAIRAKIQEIIPEYQPAPDNSVCEDTQ